MHVLLTGAAGSIGSVLRDGLRGDVARLRLLDRVPVDGLRDGEEQVVCDLADAEAVLRASTGIDTVVHLAGIPHEAPFDDLVEANIRGTHHVFEAARRQGVRRVVFASTNHVTGFHPTSARLGPETPPRPDTYYGVSKACGEALARLYHDKHGIEVVCLRIGTFAPRPTQPRELATWLSHRDGVALVLAALQAAGVGCVVAYGASRNTRGWWDLSSAEALGYRPADDAEAFADDLGAGPDVDLGPVQGGDFADVPGFLPS